MPNRFITEDSHGKSSADENSERDPASSSVTHQSEKTSRETTQGKIKESSKVTEVSDTLYGERSAYEVATEKPKLR